MMRLFVIFSVVLSLAVSVMAQDIPVTTQNSSGDGSDMQVRPDAAKGKAQGPDVRRTYFDPSGVSSLLEPKPEGPEEQPAVVTNQVKTAKIGFLMSTGMEYIDEGDYEGAERAYLRALEEDPDNDNLLFRLSTLYVTMARYGDAIRLLEQQVARYPENSLLHNNLSWCYAASAEFRNTSKALLHAREALLSTPENYSMWNTLAEAYYAAGDYEKALRSADHSLDLLSSGGASEEELQSLTEHRTKILRAQEAFKLLEGLDDEE